MPVIAWWLIAGGIAAAGAGGAIKLIGSGADDAGNGALKFAGAAAVGVGLWLAFKRLG
jgi:hypothetical protein